MSSRLCAGGCGTEVEGRRRRCPECRRSRRADLERARYHGHADAINTKRSLRRQGLSDPRPDDIGEVVVDYSVPGSGSRPPNPNAPARPYRAHPSHDRAAWVQRQAAMNSGDGEAPSWDELASRPARVPFYPGPHSPAADVSPFRRARETPETTNWAAVGQLHRPRAADGQRSLYDHLRKRR
jgi:hypothetical protein